MIVKIILLGGVDYVVIVSVDFIEGVDFGGGIVFKVVVCEVDVFVIQVGVYVGCFYILNDSVIVELYYFFWKFLEMFYNVNKYKLQFLFNI